MSTHPSFEELSAHHDGEAPEWTAHVAACATCRAQLADLTALSERVAGPVPAAPTGGADPVARAMAAAVGREAPRDAQEGAAGAAVGRRPLEGPFRPPPARPRPGSSATAGTGRSRWTAWMTGASAAAVVLLVAGVLTLFLRGGGGSDTTTALSDRSRQESSIPGSDSAAPGVAGPAETGAAADIDGAVFGGDLGEIPDAAALVARTGRDLRTGRDRAAAVPTTAPRAPTGGVRGVAPPTPGVVGTRPCEVQARDQSGGLGPVVYYASATRQGVPATVLGFAPVGGTRPVTVQVRAQSDCRLLLSASLP